MRIVPTGRRRTRPWAAVLAGLLLLAAGCLPLARPLPEAALQASLERSWEYVQAPGAVLLVSGPGGPTWRGATGFSQITVQRPTPLTGDLFSETDGLPEIDGTPLHPSAKFQAASLIKPMIATLVLRLCDRNLLSLETPAADLLPDIRPLDRAVTVRMLLNHTSGLGNYTENQAFIDALLKTPRKKWAPAELLAYGLSRPPHFPPGKGWAYSNTNYILLGLIVEKLEGEGLGLVLEREIIRPLGLKDTTFPTEAAMPPGTCRGYRYDFEPQGTWVDYTEFADPSWTWAAGALVTTVEDLETWQRALHEGRLVSRVSREAMFDFLPLNGSEGYGLGLGNWDGAVGQTGEYLFGYQCAMFRYRGYDFVIMINGAPARLGLMDGPRVIFENARDALFGSTR